MQKWTIVFLIICSANFAYLPLALARVVRERCFESTRNPAQASEGAVRARKTVHTFFQNYALIGNWPEFQATQSKLFNSNLTTLTSDHTGNKTYREASGYFQSLGDWSQWFQTTDDFKVVIVSTTPNHVIARIHGTLILKKPIQGLSKIPDSQHSWTETFTLDSSGHIVQLEVAMNLFRSSL
jgi:hypothetical protein